MFLLCETLAFNRLGEKMRISEDNNTGEVIIDDKRIAGFIFDERCKKCKTFLIYFEKYDSYFCAYCNEWQEKECGESGCDYYKNRPATPL